ncbi:BTB/POZ domain and ankyrin repeat-containing protein NPR1 isoform X1 [Syzygium oleosum]|uniref:BTB/POZ domain and ankyrin repeat-containing protein NPR1 isoform X1 n=1 Tax=Syzygium oleosum TaxID=219896 RepID=UPI0024BA247D|nr:BTB/POZ domain and ankyrin repeat-containing protein NPR1 isoform X1 [Syzygium oleosum]
MDAARLALSDSNDIASNSNGSSIYCAPATAAAAANSDSPSLVRLSDHLGSVFSAERGGDFDFFADAKIALRDGREVPVHRCILCARSAFFRGVLTRGGATKLEVKELGKDYEIGHDSLVAVLGYLYSGKVKPPPLAVRECVDEECPHAACRPAVDFLVQVLYAAFTFEISELVGLYQKDLLDILDKVSIDDLLVVLSVANMCNNACEGLSARCIELVVKSDVDVVTLDRALPHFIVKQIVDARMELGLKRPECDSFPDKHVKRIHRALDSDDVELVRMLLREAHTTLDDACALHYAVAYCDAKTTTELLDLGIADVNQRNSRGYTVLHVAALRKEPKIIVSLLVKGARASDLTLDGRKALKISKRLTRAADYYKSTEEGKASSRERLCVEILEQAERRDPLLGEAALSLAIAGDDLRKKLLYLENRVALATLLFPMEAKVAMDIAQVDGTSEYPLVSIENLARKQGANMDLNEAPFKIQEENLNRMRALSKTVELGKRFFPRCSAVINKIIDTDDLSWLATVGNDTPEERLRKRQRHIEVEEELTEAFTQDKEETDKSSILSSSSSTSISFLKPNGKLTTSDH